MARASVKSKIKNKVTAKQILKEKELESIENNSSIIEEEFDITKINETSNEKSENKPEKRKVNRDDVVTIMNNTSGIMKYWSKQTGQEWVFNNYGDTDEIEVSELIRMKNAHPTYLNDAWVLIMDEDVVEFLGLSKLYENILKPEEIDMLFKLDEEKIKEVISSVPHGMKQTIVGLAMKKIENGTLDSMRTIRAIEEACGIELTN